LSSWDGPAGLNRSDFDASITFYRGRIGLRSGTASASPGFQQESQFTHAQGPFGAVDTEDGGAEGIRTPDPHNAIVVLYQLSYDPIQKRPDKVGRRRRFVKDRFVEGRVIWVPLFNKRLGLV
jgi:hypothetical protein